MAIIIYRLGQGHKQEDSHLNGNDYIQARIRSLMPGQGHKQETVT